MLDLALMSGEDPREEKSFLFLLRKHEERDREFGVFYLSLLNILSRFALEKEDINELL